MTQSHQELLGVVFEWVGGWVVVEAVLMVEVGVEELLVGGGTGQVSGAS
jgi:hypothetical protein